MLPKEKKPQGFRYWAKGTLVLFVIFVLILFSCYGVAFKGNENTRRIFWIVFLSLCLALLLAYWAYAFVHDSHIRKDGKPSPDSKSDKDSGK